MKKIIALALALVLALSCAAVATADEAPVELTFQRIGSDAAEHDYWSWVIEEFEKANPDVKILYDDAAIGADMDTKLNTLFAAGDGPDLIGHGILSVASRVEQGHYLPIDDYFNAWSGKDNLMPSVLANGTYKGHVYGVGYSSTPFVFAYRSDLLEAANLSVPKTWDELASTARALTEKNEKGEIIPKIKCSENVEKITIPHFKKVYRLYNRDNGKAIADYMTVYDETVNENEPLMLFDPYATWKTKNVCNFEARELLVPVFLKGKRVYQSPPLKEIKSYCKQQVDTLWDEIKRFDNPQTYYVDLSQKLWDIQQELLRKNRN